MEPQHNKKDPQRPPIGVIMAAIRAINTNRARDDDEANGIWVMMKADRKISRKDIIPRRSCDEVMKDEVGGDSAAEIGRGYDGTEGGRGEVGGHENGRWQKNLEKRNEEK